ncbi:hypothetical protein [Metallosphaera hakonensis]|uniref:hypothetical protein n=1 Tax=Metallosphaera hakonensis TaxID=79601 RepID=UPI0011B289C2|nr:hypothetical protein [Metallosphaera hakonensis]QIJ32941.1 hypothetical protein DFR87_13165 [Metallosphaera hakonensis JCM 8857 = DSM 7519]
MYQIDGLLTVNPPRSSERGFHLKVGVSSFSAPPCPEGTIDYSCMFLPENNVSYISIHGSFCPEGRGRSSTSESLTTQK